MSRPLVWSYTFLSTYWSCPKQAFHKYIARDLPRVETEAMRWGNRVHEAMDKRIKGEPLPTDMVKWEPLVAPVAAVPGVRSELAVAITEMGKPTGFWDKDAWGRGKIDVLVEYGDAALILDWKTGKRREDPTELMIFAMFLRCISGDSRQKITGRYVWLQDGSIGDEHDLTNADAPMWARVENAMYEVDELKATGEPWPAKKNGLCRAWCDVLSCEHNGRRT